MDERKPSASINRLCSGIDHMIRTNAEDLKRFRPSRKEELKEPKN